MRIDQVDLRDEATFEDYYRVVVECAEDLWPGQPTWQPHEILATIHGWDGTYECKHLMARDVDGSVLGSAEICFGQLENLDAGEGNLEVLPGRRRRGVGTALLLEMERMVMAEGRRELSMREEFPMSLEHVSAGSPFAARHGYMLAQTMERRDLTLPFDESEIARLEAEAAQHSAGYRVVRWDNECAEELLAGRAELMRGMSTDAPQGDLLRDEEEWDVDRIRSADGTVARMNRTKLGVGAVHEESGALVAMSELSIPNTAPTQVYQHDTIVLGAHRGKRLGLLVKTALLRDLVRVNPVTERVCTWNAEDNAPMIGINEQLGWRLAGKVRSYKKDLRS
ncbi:MAG TPA: GNAT family N-acetyltransferase [Acidimicrobiales bacterium]|nr:GNAT family N-acetyltransferase [Acidimicrobiales bacterium]